MGSLFRLNDYIRKYIYKFEIEKLHYISSTFRFVLHGSRLESRCINAEPKSANESLGQLNWEVQWNRDVSLQVV